MLKRILIALGIILVVIVLAFGLLWYGLGKIMCGDDTLGKYSSPDGNHEIVYYERNCGATTTYMYNVELDGKTLLRATYLSPLSIKWLSDSTISINSATTTESATVYRILERYKKFQIIFDQQILTSRRE